VILNNHSSSSCSNWGKITHGISQGLIVGPLLFLLCIYELKKKTNKNSKIVLFADDTITNPNLPKTINDKTISILFADDTSIIEKSPN
jgi:hypothetical protein